MVFSGSLLDLRLRPGSKHRFSTVVKNLRRFENWFVKKYANVAQVITDAMKEYVAEVKDGTFPDEKDFCYQMIEGEEDKFLDLMKK